jgi:hypothetical protein
MTMTTMSMVRHQSPPEEAVEVVAHEETRIVTMRAMHMMTMMRIMMTMRRILMTMMAMTASMAVEGRSEERSRQKPLEAGSPVL